MYGSQRGFTLIEVMVGLVIGMLGTLIVAQAFTNNEARKRSTTSGADAQANGAIALYMLERDTKAAGWGMAAGSTSYSGCAKVYSYCDKNAECGGVEGEISNLSFAPALIKDGGTGPDTLTIQYFADPNLSSSLPPGTTKVRKKMPLPSAELDVANPTVCADGDLALVASGGNCTLMQITQVQDTAGKLQHNSGASGHYNPSPDYMDTNAWPKYPLGASVSCFKPANGGPVFRKIYSVNTAAMQLERSDNSQAPAIVNEVVMADVVDVQAEYGVATTALSQTVDKWVSAAKDEWVNPTPNDWNRIKAVRVALVARASQYERPASASAGCNATSSLTASWHTFDTSKYPADWGCYRYRVFETVIPLRNVIWGKI